MNSDEAKGKEVFVVGTIGSLKSDEYKAKYD
jgi:hypothetical protein